MLILAVHILVYAPVVHWHSAAVYNGGLGCGGGGAVKGVIYSIRGAYGQLVHAACAVKARLQRENRLGRGSAVGSGRRGSHDCEAAAAVGSTSVGGILCKCRHLDGLEHGAVGSRQHKGLARFAQRKARVQLGELILAGSQQQMPAFFYDSARRKNELHGRIGAVRQSEARKINILAAAVIQLYPVGSLTETVGEAALVLGTDLVYAKPCPILLSRGKGCNTGH